jgi:hypothetical protein
MFLRWPFRRNGNAQRYLHLLAETRALGGSFGFRSESFFAQAFGAGLLASLFALGLFYARFRCFALGFFTLFRLQPSQLTPRTQLLTVQIQFLNPLAARLERT